MRKHIILITTFGHSTFFNHCQVFSSVHPNNLEIDHPRQLCTTTSNNSLNLICFKSFLLIYLYIVKYL